MVDNVMVSTKGTKRGLDKLKSVIGMKNLRCNEILSDNIRDEKDDRTENLRVITEKVDPIHTSVTIDKQDIMTMAQNIGGTREIPNITMKKIKRCGRVDAIMTRVRRLMMFA